MSTSPIPGMVLLKRIEDFDGFSAVRGVPAESVSEQLIEAVRKLDEREELEPYIRLILHDPIEGHRVLVGLRSTAAHFFVVAE